MKTLIRSDFQKVCDKGGYMIYYLGHGIRGAGTLSKGSHIRGRAVMKQIKSYSEMAEHEIEGMLLAGENGPDYERILEIQQIFEKK